jgi:hypothetical protein
VECIQLLEHFHLIFLFFLPFLEKYSKTLTLSLPYIFHENHLTDFLFNMSYATILLQDAHESLVIFLYHTNYESKKKISMELYFFHINSSMCNTTFMLSTFWREHLENHFNTIFVVSRKCSCFL